MKPDRAVAGILLLTSLVLCGCSQKVKIEDILADPSRWARKTVRIEGTVQNSVGAIGRGAYEVSDDTDTIWVISSSGVPSRGALVAVEGRVFQGAQFLGQSYGVALREKRHRSL